MVCLASRLKYYGKEIPSGYKYLDYLSSQHNEKRTLIHELNGNPEPRTLEYFKNVNTSVIQKLYDFYKIDFELFNYNLHGLMQ